MTASCFHLRQYSVNVPHMIVEVDRDKLECFRDIQWAGIRMAIDQVVLVFQIYFTEESFYFFSNIVQKFENRLISFLKYKLKY